MRRACRSARAVLTGSFLAAVGASALATAAQEPPRDEGAPVVFRATTELVQFDAIVVNAGGDPVTTLTIDDFEARQDGQRVELKDVTFIDRARTPTRGDAPD